MVVMEPIVCNTVGRTVWRERWILNLAENLNSFHYKLVKKQTLSFNNILYVIKIFGFRVTRRQDEMSQRAVSDL